MVQLSKRLQAVADFVDNCGILADVGTDHGYIPVCLVEWGKARRAIAMDVNQGPLLRAEEHIRRYGMGKRIETRLSDGCSALKPGEADVIVISGLGGGLMMEILRQGEQVVRTAESLVLQPQSELMAFREFLYENGYEVKAETMVQEDGKYYPVIKARTAASAGMSEESTTAGREPYLPANLPGHISEEQYARIAFRYGPMLLAQNHPVLREYLLNQKEQKEKILLHLRENARQNARGRMEEVQQELEDVRKALEWFECPEERRII